MGRGRTRVVCLFCRRRKIKCDQNCPCSACIKHQVHCDLNDAIADHNEDHKAHKADEDISALPSKAEPSRSGTTSSGEGSYEELALLKERLASLEDAVQRNAAKRRKMNLEHLPELTLREYKINFHASIKTYPDNTFSRYQVGPFRRIVMLSLDPTIFGLFKEFVTQRFNKKNKDHKKERCLHLLGGSEPKCSKEDLVVLIQLALPKPYIIWALVERFYKILYPYVPFIDEVVFKSWLVSIIGPVSVPAGIVTIAINQRTDYAYLGILLLILRLAHLSLFDGCNCLNAGPRGDAHDIEALAQVPIPDVFVEYAEQCLGTFNLLKDNEIEIIQLLALLRTVNYVNPMVTKPYDHNQTVAALHIQMAMSSWINREPGQYSNEEGLEKRINQNRNLWYCLVFLDFQLSVSLGSFPQIHPDTFNVELPAVGQRVLKFFDLELEHASRAHFHRLDRLRKTFMPALMLVGRVGGEFSIGEILQKLRPIEDCQCNAMEEISDFSSQPAVNIAESVYRNSVLQVYLWCQYFSFCTYYHIYFFYHRRNEYEQAGNVEVRLVQSIVNNILPLIPYKCGQRLDPFAGTTDLFSGIAFFECVWPISLALLVFLAKYNSYLVAMSLNDMHEARKASDPRYFNLHGALEKYTKTLIELLNIFTSFFEATRRRYYICEKLYNFQRYCVDAILDFKGLAKDEGSYVKVAPPFLVGCNEIIRNVIDKPEFDALKRYHPPSPFPSKPPTLDIGNKSLGAYDFLNELSPIIDFQELEAMMGSS